MKLKRFKEKSPYSSNQNVAERNGESLKGEERRTHRV